MCRGYAWAADGSIVAAADAAPCPRGPAPFSAGRPIDRRRFLAWLDVAEADVDVYVQAVADEYMEWRRRAEFVAALDAIDGTAPFGDGLPMCVDGVLDHTTEFPNGRKVYERTNAEAVHETRFHEWRSGIHLGPFTKAELVELLVRLTGSPHYRTVPIDVIIKELKTRVVLNYSKSSRRRGLPDDDSVNARSPTEPVHYDLVPYAIRMSQELIDRCGVDSVEYVSVDGHEAYHQHRYNSASFPYCVWRWFDLRQPLPADLSDPEAKLRYYIETVLPFGHVRSVHWFDGWGKAGKWLFLHPDTAGLPVRVPRACKELANLLDDNLGIFAPGFGARGREEMLTLAAILGQEPSAKKLLRADGEVSAVKVFAGVLLDSIRQQHRMPEDKVRHAREITGRLRKLRFTPRKTLEKVVGFLEFCSLGSAAGATFLRRLHSGLRDKSRWAKLTRGMRIDLEWWHSLWADGWNGIGQWLDRDWRYADQFDFFWDACTKDAKTRVGGFGAVFGSEFIAGVWPAEAEGLSINVLEHVTGVVAVHTWARRLAGRKQVVRGDNEVSINVSTKGAAKHPGLMLLDRELHRDMTKHNFRLKFKHFPGRFNVLADLLSRGDFTGFFDHYSRMMAPRFGPAVRVDVDMDYLRTLLVRIKAAVAAAGVEDERLRAQRRPRA